MELFKPNFFPHIQFMLITRWPFAWLTALSYSTKKRRNNATWYMNNNCEKLQGWVAYCKVFSCFRSMWKHSRFLQMSVLLWTHLQSCYQNMRRHKRVRNRPAFLPTALCQHKRQLSLWMQSGLPAKQRSNDVCRYWWMQPIKSLLSASLCEYSWFVCVQLSCWV